MIFLVLAAASTLLSLETTPPPIDPAAAFDWYVLSELNSFYDNPEDPTDRPVLLTQVPAGIVKPVDINHDGKTDWLIEWPESAQFCGTGGCERSLYVSTPDHDGFTRALDRQTLDLKIEDVGGETRIEAWVHHMYCDEAREECRFAWAWDDKARRLVQRPAGDGITLLDGVGAEVVDGDIRADRGDAWPIALGNAWEASRVVCLTDDNTGYSITHSDIATIPDVSGDGRPDWVVSAPRPCDGAAPAEPFAIWTTTGEGDLRDGVQKAYEAPPGTALRLDLAGPTVLVSPGCGTPDDADQTKCRYVPLKWDGPMRVLTE